MEVAKDERDKITVIFNTNKKDAAFCFNQEAALQEQSWAKQMQNEALARSLKLDATFARSASMRNKNAIRSQSDC